MSVDALTFSRGLVLIAAEDVVNHWSDSSGTIEPQAPVPIHKLAQRLADFRQKDATTKDVDHEIRRISAEEIYTHLSQSGDQDRWTVDTLRAAVAKCYATRTIVSERVTLPIKPLCDLLWAIRDAECPDLFEKWAAVVKSGGGQFGTALGDLAKVSPRRSKPATVPPGIEELLSAAGSLVRLCGSNVGGNTLRDAALRLSRAMNAFQWDDAGAWLRNPRTDDCARLVKAMESAGSLGPNPLEGWPPHLRKPAVEPWTELVMLAAAKEAGHAAVKRYVGFTTSAVMKHITDAVNWTPEHLERVRSILRSSGKFRLRQDSSGLWETL